VRGLVEQVCAAHAQPPDRATLNDMLADLGLRVAGIVTP
jgi:hypothetical protein